MASEDVIKLEFPDHVRLRFGMYIGSADNSDVLLREIVDNSVDELYAGKVGPTPCDTIWIEARQGSYLVADNCRGIPIRESSEKGITMARMAVGSLNAGSKFKKINLAIGLNGVGSSCVNALSSSFVVMSRVDLQDLDKLPENLKIELPKQLSEKVYYFCRFKEGIFVEEGFKEYERKEFNGQYPSTITLFTPDTQILRSQKAALPDTLPYIKYIMKRLGRNIHIYYNGVEYSQSIESYGIDLGLELKSPEGSEKNPKIQMFITMGFQNKEFGPQEIIGSVNGLNCCNGAHIKWAQASFCKAFDELFSNCGQTSLMGTRMCVICLCNEPAFSSQTKTRLTEVDGFKFGHKEELTALAQEFKIAMKNNYDLFKTHEQQVLEYLKSTEKIGRKEFIKSTVLIAAERSRPEAFVPNKLVDCSNVDRSQCELYVCFTGDTTIRTSTGTETFLTLQEKLRNGRTVYTYCRTPDGIQETKIIESKQSSEVTKTIKITMENGGTFECTPDHKILMRTGEYLRAEKLSVNDVCMHNSDFSNGKIIVIETRIYYVPIPVYCLTVQNTCHNFLLGCGIFVKNCEGESASGALAKIRDPRIHAILPLRGKPLNTAGLEIETVLGNAEMKDLISSIGVGVNDYHNLSEVRYGKVIIVADADADGQNINALCLGALATHLTFLVEAGYVFIARSPLFEQNGNYFLSKDGLIPGKKFSRFKGLGECNPEDLEPFVFSKATRSLIRVTMDNWEDARNMLTSASAKRQIMVDRGVISDILVPIK